MYKANEICVNFKNDKWEIKKEGSSNWIEKGQVLRMISSILVASEVYHSSQSKAVGLLEKLSRAFLKMSEKIREGIDQGDDWKKADTFLSYQSYCRKETFKGNGITCNCSNSTDDSSDQNLISTMIWIKNGPSLPWFLAIPHFGFTPAVAVANSWGPVFEVGPFFIDHLLQFPPGEVLPLCLKGPLSKSIGQSMMEAAFWTRGGSTSFSAIMRVMVVGVVQILRVMAVAGMIMFAFTIFLGETIVTAVSATVEPVSQNWEANQSESSEGQESNQSPWVADDDIVVGDTHKKACHNQVDERHWVADSPCPTLVSVLGWLHVGGHRCWSKLQAKKFLRRGQKDDLLSPTVKRCVQFPGITKQVRFY